MEHNDITKCDFPKFFVTGMSRVGTTLLAAMLSQRPDTHVISDSLVISRLTWDYKNMIVSRANSRYGHTDIFPVFPDNMNQLITPVEAKLFLSILINAYTPGNLNNSFRNRLNYSKYIEMIDIKYIFQKIEDSNHGMSWKEFLGILFMELVPEGKKDCEFIGEKATGHMDYYDYVVKNEPNDYSIYQIETYENSLQTSY
jgi:hypothetical protein